LVFKELINCELLFIFLLFLGDAYMVASGIPQEVIYFIIK